MKYMRLLPTNYTN